jgi:hypothetical protein
VIPHPKLLSKVAIVIISVSALAALIAGCMSDPIIGPQVLPQLVNGPPNASFFATNYQAPTSGDMVIRWTHSPTDTQHNFKGYFIRVYSSNEDNTATPPYDLHQLLDTTTVYKQQQTNHVDTSYTVHALPIGYYTIMINGEQVSDTMRLSVDTFTYSNEFDPRPLVNPTNLMASSAGSQQVNLHWTLSPSESLPGFGGYAVYYVDPDPQRVPRDSAHLLTTPYLPAGTTTYLANVPAPPASINGGTTTLNEWPYRFWVKAVRKDSVQFYDDSSAIVWSGAENAPPGATDSTAFHHALFFGFQNNIWDMTDDSMHTDEQVKIDISGQTLTLTAMNGAIFNTQIDLAVDLDSIYYSSPVPVLNFTQSSITLPPITTDTLGRVVYLQFPDPALQNKPEWARIFIHHQSDGTFITASNGAAMKGSFQPGVTKAGDSHLPYY